HRFPFAAPLAVWVLGALFSFVDGRLIVFSVSTSVAGVVAAFLLGSLPDGRRSRVGLATVLISTAVIEYDDPAHTSGQLVFIQLRVAFDCPAGSVVRERSDQAEAAGLRATMAEQEREAAARLAVAEERARIARELHDIVAHAVSVMVLQVGTVRRRLPNDWAEE